MGADEFGLDLAPVADMRDAGAGGAVLAPGVLHADHEPLQPDRDRTGAVAGLLLAYGGEQRAAFGAVRAAFGEQADGAVPGEAVQPALGFPVAFLGGEQERAGLGTVRTGRAAARTLPGPRAASIFRLVFFIIRSIYHDRTAPVSN